MRYKAGFTIALEIWISGRNHWTKSGLYHLSISRPTQDPSQTDLSSDPDPRRKWSRSKEKNDLDPAKDLLLKLDLDPVKIRSDPVSN